MEDEIELLRKSFARNLRAEDRATRTITTYCAAVEYFRLWLIEQGHPPTRESLQRLVIREWIATLVDRGHAPATVKIRFRSLYRFCGWLVTEGDLTENPMIGLKSPEPKLKPVPVLDDAALIAMLKTCKTNSFEDRRDEVILRVFLDCGPRVSELASVPLESVDLDTEVIMVLGKGGKLRPLYPSTRTIRAIDRYLRVRRQHRHARLPALLLTQRGQITDDSIRKRVRVRAAQAAITERINPHQFRHTWAHDFLMEGGQERDLKRLAGWTSDTMLSIYGASAADSRAKAAAQRMRRGDRV